MAERYDIAIIGAGPGGYVAAIRAAQLGFRVACIESRETLGGTCLNIGCIPSKTLLVSSERFVEAREKLAEHGITAGEVSFDLAAMMARKGKVVEGLTRGVEFLFRKNRIDWKKGRGRIAAPGRVVVTADDGSESEIEAPSIVVATGSEPTPLPGAAIDEKRIVSSTGALALERVPRTLAVIGGGYIGLELGSMWQRLGAKVTVIEALDRILPTMDPELGQALLRELSRQGITFHLGAPLVATVAGEEGVSLDLEEGKMEAERVLVAVGRRPFTEGLGLEALGVTRDDGGRILVDSAYATNVPGIYAIGDTIAGPMLAHKASEEGIALAERLAGQKPSLNYDAIPAVVYTAPEAACVGKSEEELKAVGVSYRVGKFPFAANPRARTNGETEGFVKILAESESDRVLGVHILGAEAGTMIAEAALAMEFGASAEDIARTCHAHPSVNEAIKEAALASDGRAIHF